MKTIGKLVIIAWIARIAFFGLGVFFFTGVFSQVFNGDNRPDIEDARYAIQSYTLVEGNTYPSRIYFADDVKYRAGLPMIVNYFRFDGKKYHKVTAEKVFTEPIKIVKRTLE